MMTEEEKRIRRNERAKLYYQRHKASSRDYNKHEKIGEWKIVYQTSKNIAIMSKYLKFRFYTPEKTYDEMKYEPLRRKIFYSIGCENITTIDKGRIEVYIKGMDNVKSAIDKADEIIAEYERIYGTEYPTSRSRNYVRKKKCAEDLES